MESIVDDSIFAKCENQLFYELVFMFMKINRKSLLLIKNRNRNVILMFFVACYVHKIARVGRINRRAMLRAQIFIPITFFLF
jgi:hypothetical protein